VLIPALDSEATIAQQLEALAAQRYGGTWEVVVSDNGSTDGTLDVVRSFEGRLPRLKLTRTSENGRGAALNAALKVASGELLLCSDADDVVAPGWISALAAGAQESDLVGGFCEVEMLNEPVVRAWRRPFSPHELPRIFQDKPFAVGCNMAVWKRVVEDIGGWQGTDRGVVADDVEFALRAQAAGHSLGFARDAVVHYRYRTSLGATFRQAFNYGLGELWVYSEFKHRGLRRPSLVRALAVWGWLVIQVPAIALSKGRRGLWVMTFGFRWGRIVGSVRHRTLCL
jgi:glycosyltransferase involved in cell wall biosynthesis